MTNPSRSRRNIFMADDGTLTKCAATLQPHCDVGSVRERISISCNLATRQTAPAVRPSVRTSDHPFPPHPIPLPRGEGAALPTSGQSAAFQHGPTRRRFLPLPEGEGRGEGEGDVLTIRTCNKVRCARARSETAPGPDVNLNAPREAV